MKKLLSIVCVFGLCCVVFGEGVGRTIEEDMGLPPLPKAGKAGEQEILNYRRWETVYDGDRTKYKAVWEERKLSELRPYLESKTGGVYVDIEHGHTGLHNVSAILVPYDKFKDDRNLAVFNKSKNIALLAFDRWNTSCLAIGSPDAGEIIQRHGFKCSALDVARMLRLIAD